MQAAKHAISDLLNFAALELAEVASGREIFETTQKSVGDQTLGKNLGMGCRKRKAVLGWKQLAYGKQARRVVLIENAKRTSRSRRDILTNISFVIMSNNLPRFCESFWKFWK